MACNVFINFNGNCRDALEFYTQVFKLSAPKIMTYGEAHGPKDSTPTADIGRVLYATLPIAGGNMMFSDCPSDFHHVTGNNFAVTLRYNKNDILDVKRIFAELCCGGKIAMPLEPTFFSELFGMVTDKFGVTWQLSVE